MSFVRRSRLLSGLAARMVLWTAAVAATVLVVLLFWQHQVAIARIEQEAQAHIRLVTEGAAAHIDAQLGLLQGVADGLAQFLEKDELETTQARVLDLQRQVLQRHPAVMAVGITLEPWARPAEWSWLAPHTQRLHNGFVSGNRLGDGDRPLQEDWYQLPMQLDAAAWGEPFLRNGTERVTYSVPLHLSTRTGPRFAGVLSVDVDLRWLDDLMQRQPLGKRGYGVIVTRDGTFVSHPLESVEFAESLFSLAAERHDESTRELAQQALKGEPGLVSRQNLLHDEPSWLGWHPLRTTGWTMVAIISRATLQQEIRAQSLRAGLLALGGLVALIAALIWVARTITRPVSALSAAVGELAQGHLDARLPKARGRDEVAQLTRAFGAMRGSLQQHIAELQDSTAKRQRMQSELDIARRIQMALLPRALLPAMHAQAAALAALMEPAREVGGDFYDYFLLDENRLVLTIGDVSGKGVPAALFMAVTRSLLRAAFRTQSDPGAVLTQTNDMLLQGNDTCMFVTLFCAVVHLESGWVDYVNAGHNPPLWLRQGEPPKWVREHAPVPAAALMEGLAYETHTLRLADGDALLLYTDGVTEAMNADDAQYGDDRLARQAQQVMVRGADESLQHILSDIRRFADGAEQSDDITLLMFGWRAADAQVPAWRARVAPTHAELEGALSELDAFLQSRGLGAGQAQAIRLVAEELGTNVVKYGYDEPGEGHELSLAVELGAETRVVLEDDGRPFDPTGDVATPDPHAGVSERPIGGLGIALVRKLAQSMAYERADGRNRLRVTLKARSESA